MKAKAKAPTTKDLLKRINVLVEGICAFSRRVSYPETTGHSFTPQVNKDGKQQVVAVAEFISAVKSAEVLGYKTELTVASQGGEIGLRLNFVKYPTVPADLLVG